MAGQPQRFGDYLLLKPLGAGGMGAVHFAVPLMRDSGVPSPVVIKLLHVELSAKPDVVRRFAHEARIATLIESPHVARVYDAGRVGDTMYIAMEYVPGWSLSQVIHDLRSRGRVAPLPSVLKTMQGILRGLAALHGALDAEGQPLGIVHRDLAPKNVMLGQDGRARVIDLGLGKSTHQDWLTRAGAVLGTPGYMAPEQVQAGRVDHRTDLYTAGLVLFELLTLDRYIKGEGVAALLFNSSAPPFRPASTLRPEIPPAVDRVLERALALEPAARFSSALEFETALLAAARPEEQAAPTAEDTLLGDVARTEIATQVREAAALASGAEAYTAPTIEPTVVEVFARALAAPLGLPETDLTAPPRVSAPAPALAPPAIVLAPAVPPTPAPHPARPARSWAAVAMIGALAVVASMLGIGIALEEGRRRGVSDGARPAAESVAPAPVVARPAVAAPPEPEASPPAAEEPSARPNPHPPSEPPPRHHNRAPAHREASAPAPLPAPPPAAAAPNADQRAAELLRRLLALRKNHPDDAALEATLHDAIRLRASGTVEPANVQSLERRVTELEGRLQ
jgi:serine/threonine-protein kinase